MCCSVNGSVCLMCCVFVCCLVKQIAICLGVGVGTLLDRPCIILQSACCVCDLSMHLSVPSTGLVCFSMSEVISSFKSLRRVGVEPITTFIRSGRLRWYGHVMREGDEDWVKKCMEYRVEGRRPVGRPRKTWLESVEVDMAEREIDKEDVHDRSKWRRIVNVMKRKSNPIGKRTINR